MRRILYLLAFLCFLPLPARSQGGFTTVTGTITDPNGVKWSCGTISAQLITAGGAAPTLNGGGFTTQTSPVSLGCPTTPGSGANGSFAMRLADSGVISPSNTTWRFTVNTTGNAPPLGTGPQSFTFTTAINCSTNTPSTCTSNQLDISTQLSAIAPALGGGGGSTSPSSLTTFFNKYYGLAPDDCGNVGCTTPVTPAIRYVKFCYDGVVTGAPTTTFKSLGTAAITNTALTNNVATYTISGAAPLASGELMTVTGSTNGGGVFNITNQPIANYNSGATTFTVNITNANVGSAADTGTATGSCANFQALDATSTIEILQGGLVSPLDVSTTISAVVSASQVTLGATAGTNATGKKFWYGTDATTPLQNWVTAINNGIPTAIGLSTHSGYLPGLYLTTKPLRFVNPLGAFNAQGICSGTTGAGYGTPEPWSLQNANESLYLTGQGTYRSGILAGSQFNWATAGTAANTGVVYFTCWNGPTLSNFGVMSPDYGIAFNTSTLTGKFGGFFDDANGHEYVSGMEIQNFHNTTSSLVADQMINGTFESMRTDMQIYNNDCAGVYGGGTTSSPVFRGFTMTGVVWGGTRGSGCSPAAAVVFGGGGSGSSNSVHVTNFILDSEAGSADMPAGNGLINFAQSALTDDSDEYQFENGRIQTAQPNNFAVSVNTSVTKLKLSFTNVNLVNTGTAGATTQLVLNQSANVDWNFFGGSLNCNGTCANGISNATGSVIHTHGTRQFGTIGVVGTGSGSVFFQTPGATGWSGPGVWQSTLNVSNQGAAQTSGNVVLSAGWGSTATVTAVAGFAQNHRFTITSQGAGIAANPTITDTLPTALPTSATVCAARMEGGSGAFTMVTNTTPSATAPVFTFNGTPVTANTYIIDIQCGP